MTQPFLKAYSELLIQTCHRRGALAMGGMAAQIPISGDPDRQRRSRAGPRARRQAARSQRRPRRHLGGASGADPDRRKVFDEQMPSAEPARRAARRRVGDRDELIRPSIGTITRAGFDNNVEVCVRYLAAWLDGQGCVPIHWLMEDAATAEISRTQLWQWLHHGESAPGRRLADRFRAVRPRADRLPSKLADRMTLPGARASTKPSPCSTSSPTPTNSPSS